MIYFYLVLLSLFAFVSSFTFYTEVKDRIVSLLPKYASEYMFLALPIFCFTSLIAATYMTGSYSDVLFAPSLKLILVALFGIFCIGFSGFSRFAKILRSIIIMLCTGLCVYMLPADYFVFNVKNFTLGEKFFIWGLWCLLSLGYPILGFEKGLAALHTICIMLAICIFYLLSAVSILSFATALVILSFSLPIFMLEMSDNKKILDTTALSVLGFIVGWAVVCAGGDGIIGPMEIVLVYFETEIVLWIFNRCLLFKHNYKIAVYSAEYSPTENFERIISVYVRAQSFIFILALMQLFAPQSQALSLFAVLIVLWIMGKFGSSDKNQSLSEINKEFIENLKHGLSDISDVFRNKKK